MTDDKAIQAQPNLFALAEYNRKLIEQNPEEKTLGGNYWYDKDLEGQPFLFCSMIAWKQIRGNYGEQETAQVSVRVGDTATGQFYSPIVARFTGAYIRTKLHYLEEQWQMYEGSIVFTLERDTEEDSYGHKPLRLVLYTLPEPPDEPQSHLFDADVVKSEQDEPPSTLGQPAKPSRPLAANSGQIAAFLAQVKDTFGMTPRQAMDALGVRSLDGMNLAAAYEQLKRVVPARKRQIKRAS